VFHVVLFQPEIPPNTGNIGRLCLATGARLHLVRPLGFSLDDRALKRAGLDYWGALDVQTWDSLDALKEEASSKNPGTRFFLLTTKAQKPYWSEKFRAGDHLVFGPETRGLPEALLQADPGACLTIPMVGKEARSLNLATAAGIVLYEAVRQSAGAAPGA
jgi:tRNA (cytidine/uridine-2'-O-)-methyltransferase